MTMRSSCMLILFILTSTLSMGQKIIELEALQGKWFVQLTNFPMWLKGDKTNPEFNYRIVEQKSGLQLLDEVVYEKGNKRKTITGYDTPADSSNTAFIWRGKGLLFFVQSKWSIRHLAPNREWMLIHFDKTLFTPEGYDVITRKETVSPEIQAEIVTLLAEKCPETILSKTIRK